MLISFFCDIMLLFFFFFFFKQKTAYEMRISDWSSDVCSSDGLRRCRLQPLRTGRQLPPCLRTGFLHRRSPYTVGRGDRLPAPAGTRVLHSQRTVLVARISLRRPAPRRGARDRRSGFSRRTRAASTSDGRTRADRKNRAREREQ